MASGIVITVVEKMYAVLHSQELKDFCSMLGFESQLDDLAITISTIKAVLLDAECKHQALTHAGREYVERLKDAVYDTDDLLDEFNTMVQKEKIKPGGKYSKRLRRFFSRSNQIFVAHKMSNEIIKLRENLDKIAKDHQQFGLTDVYVPVKRKEQSMSYGNENNIIGREADKKAIVGMLLRDSETLNNKCSYVTIVGIGGLGKTALGQLVYNDSRIVEGFDMRLWVCVSEDFGVEQIFRKIVGKKGLNCNIEELQNQVRKLIEGKKYLLILDDVWCESPNEWAKVKTFLGLGGKGSKILITTRSKMVASVVGDELMYELQGLSEENSWNLFKRMAFKQAPVDDDVADSPSSLIIIGKEIVRKCANVPLCVRVIGSMLYEQNESKWVSFRNLDLTKMGQGEDGIMPILKFSYHHLTPTLKSCFSYCALFPKDWEIKKDELIKLWLAQGCLEAADVRSPEDIGEECFSILLNKCFLQDITWEDECDEIKSCKMHDLIHDLARDVAGKECQMLDDSNACHIDKKTRHVSRMSFRLNMLSTLNDELIENKTLRTVSLPVSLTDASEPDVTVLLSRLRRVRVLDLCELKLKTLPDMISRLSHLRSLNLCGNRDLKILPESIVKLHNLQVLDLSNTRLTELPRDTMKLVSLRHLNLNGCYNLTNMPVGMNNMTCLHTLTLFIVGDETSKQKIGRLRDLEALVNLSGHLFIIFRPNARCNLDDLNGAQLLQKAHLKRLRIFWGIRNERDISVSDDEPLLRVLQPRLNLEFLAIAGYHGLKLPKWVDSVSTSLPFLVTINLERCNRVEHVPSMRKLRHLKKLSLLGLQNVEFIENDKCDDLIFFPSLETLSLCNLPKLRRWCGNDCVSQISSFPRLHNLDIYNCPNLTTIPGSPNLKTLDLKVFNEALTCMGAPNLGNSGILESVSIDNVRVLNGLIKEPLRDIHRLVIFQCMEESLCIAAGEGYLRCASSLRDLFIIDSPKLKSLSGSGLPHWTNLKSLTLSTCNSLELDGDDEGMMPWASLHSLSSLILFDLPKMVNLPKGLQYLTRLQSLGISGFDDLEGDDEGMMPWASLHSLSSLFLDEIPKMVNLPKGLQYCTSLQSLTIGKCANLEALPDWLSCLTSLTFLCLYSKKLRERCREPNGQDWPKICLIPRINLPGWLDN